MSIEPLIHRPVETLPATASCAAAAALMRDRNIGSVIVTEDDDRPLGVVTDRDLAVRVIAEGRDGTRLTVREIMSTYPVFVHRERSLEDVVRAMRDMAVRRMPVIDHLGRIDGMISMDDVVMYLARQLEGVSEAIATELATHQEPVERG